MRHIYYTKPYSVSNLLILSKYFFGDIVWVPFSTIGFIAKKTGRLKIIYNISIPLYKAYKSEMVRGENEKILLATVCFHSGEDEGYRVASSYGNF
jgi:hypothetical protein